MVSNSAPLGEPLAPVGGATHLLWLRGAAVVRQSRVAVWDVVGTVAGSRLGVVRD